MVRALTGNSHAMRGAAVSIDVARRALHHVVIAANLFWALVLAASAVACHSDTTPDLSRLYASGMEEGRTRRQSF